MSCGSFCDYEKYYLIQAGGARDDILYYSGIPYQRGSNIFFIMANGLEFLYLNFY